MCLCGLRGLETISFTFTPVSPGAIKELLGKSKQIRNWLIFFQSDYEPSYSSLGACPRLERIEVHIGISDYFTDVKDEGNIRKYEQIVKTLTVCESTANKLFCHNLVNCPIVLRCII